MMDSVFPRPTQPDRQTWAGLPYAFGLRWDKWFICNGRLLFDGSCRWGLLYVSGSYVFATPVERTSGPRPTPGAAKLALRIVALYVRVVAPKVRHG